MCPKGTFLFGHMGHRKCTFVVWLLLTDEERR